MKLHQQLLPPSVQKEILLRLEPYQIEGLARICKVNTRLKRHDSMVDAIVESGKLAIRADVSIGLEDSLETEKITPPVDPALGHERQANWRKEREDWNENIEVTGANPGLLVDEIDVVPIPPHLRPRTTIGERFLESLPVEEEFEEVEFTADDAFPQVVAAKKLDGLRLDERFCPKE